MNVLANHQSAAGPARHAPSPGWITASLALCMLLPALGTSIANVALPTLASDFSAPFRQVQWVVLAYLLANTASIVSVGRLGDIVGRKRLLIAGVALFTAASGLCGLAPRLDLLIAARAAQGLGAAAMMALGLAFVGEAVPKSHAGRAMGMLGAMSATGTALGPTLGGLLIARFGWPSIFLVMLPLGVLALALVLAQRCLPRDRAASKAAQPRFDVIGSLRRDPALLRGLAMSALVSTVVMATLVVGPFYLVRALGLDAAKVGIAMSVGPAIAALTGVPAGRAVDRLGAQRMTVIGLGGMVAGCLALSLAPAVLCVAGYVLPLAIVTGSYALFQTANNTAVMAGAAPDRRGVLAGMLNLSRNLGLICGAAAMGAVFAFAAGTDDIATASPDAVAIGMRVTFGVAAVLVIAALAIAAGSPARARTAAPARA